jgi:hypothetical protein
MKTFKQHLIESAGAYVWIISSGQSYSLQFTPERIVPASRPGYKVELARNAKISYDDAKDLQFYNGRDTIQQIKYRINKYASV